MNVAHKGALTVLVADDDPNDFLLFEVALERAGLHCDLHTVRDGQEALDYLAAAPPYQDRNCCPWPQLLILDLKMPRVGGIEVLRWIQETPNLPTIYTAVLTGSTSPADINLCRALGANVWLSKPCDLKRFATMLSELAKHCVQPESRRAFDGHFAFPQSLFGLAFGEARPAGPPPRFETDL